MDILTIGHSNHSAERLLELLRQHSVDVLVDARSHPYSRYAPQFDMPALRKSLRNGGVRYLFLGPELGGRPRNPEFYDDEGYVLYYLVARSSLFREGITRLLDGAQRFRVALLCSEENPLGCHRRLLVGRVLRQHGVNVVHIRGDGSLQPDETLPDAVPQPALFGGTEEPEWKSLRSVSPKKPQNNSLSH